MKETLNDIDIIILHILQDFGFRQGNYQLNIFPSNKKLAEKAAEFITEFNSDPSILPSEKDISFSKDRLKDKKIISYYVNKDLNNRRVIKINLDEIVKYQERIDERMKYWNKHPQPAVKESKNYNEDHNFNVQEYSWHDAATILH